MTIISIKTIPQACILTSARTSKLRFWVDLVLLQISLFFSECVDNQLPRSVFVVEIDLNVRLQAFVIHSCCVRTGKEFAGDRGQDACVRKTERQHFAIMGC